MANLNSSIVNGFLRVTGKLKTYSLEVESTDLVQNLNADLLDGKHSTDFATSAEVSAVANDLDAAEVQIQSNKDTIDGILDGTIEVPVTVEVADAEKLDGHPSSYYAKASDVSGKVDKTGDTMTGNLTLPELIVQGTASQNVIKKITSNGNNIFIEVDGNILGVFDATNVSFRSRI